MKRFFFSLTILATLALACNLGPAVAPTEVLTLPPPEAPEAEAPTQPSEPTPVPTQPAAPPTEPTEPPPTSALAETPLPAPGTPLAGESGLVSTCAAFQVPIGNGGPTLPPLPDEMEAEIGAQAAAEVEQTYTLLTSGEALERVTRIGQSIVPYSDRSTITYTFNVIVSDEINAFALPGGFIYIYSGLLDFVETDDELAAVLGHEIAHVARCHGAQQIQYEMAQIMRARRGGGRRPGETVFRDERARLGGAMRAQVFEAGWSREQELEADEHGTIYMAYAGYDPQAVIDALARLMAISEQSQSRIERMLATHPPFPVRIETVERTIEENGLAQ